MAWRRRADSLLQLGSLLDWRTTRWAARLLAFQDLTSLELIEVEKPALASKGEAEKSFEDFKEMKCLDFKDL